jgi:excinuclease ABC subunit A
MHHHEGKKFTFVIPGHSLAARQDTLLRIQAISAQEVRLGETGHLDLPFHGSFQYPSDMSSQQWIRIRGARTHNLRNLDVDVPRDCLTVFTGPSGSGKSSLAFDTIHAEGQRRYLETLRCDTRALFAQLQRPDVDQIDGLPPTLCVAQQAGSAQRRSTLATITEIHDHLRLLWARLGTPHCLECGRAVVKQSVGEIVRETMALEEGHKVFLLAPLVRDQPGEHREVFQSIRQGGFLRARLDGVLEEIREIPKIDGKRKHTIELVVDRLVIRPGIEERLAESLATAVKHGNGQVVVTQIDDGDWHDHFFSTKLACAHCGLVLPDLEPRLFSFNNPDGACPTCAGLGQVWELDPARLVPDRSRTLKQVVARLSEQLPEAVRVPVPDTKLLAVFGEVFPAPLSKLPALTPASSKLAASTTRQITWDPHGPLTQWPDDAWQALMHGSEHVQPAWPGWLPELRRLSKEAEDGDDAEVRQAIDSLAGYLTCPDCGGARLRHEVRAVRFEGKALNEVTAMTVDNAAKFFVREPEAQARDSERKTHEHEPEAQMRDPEEKAALVREPEAQARGSDAQARGSDAQARGSDAQARGSDAQARDPLACASGSQMKRDSLACASGSQMNQVRSVLLQEISTRLGFLQDVGLGYLTLDRPAPTLSGGEIQRARLATHLGGHLLGVCYVLDEPTIGLHPRDTQRLLTALRGLQRRGNTLIVVEHDEEVMRQADYLVDMGPGAGRLGGKLLACGTVAEVLANSASVTAPYLLNTTFGLARRPAKPQSSESLVIRGARHNNLKNITVTIPLGRLVCITGVSGSGKSSLARDILCNAVRRHLGLLAPEPGRHAGIYGLEHIDKIIEVDQSPLGRSTRSSPATYTGVYDEIRKVFAATRTAKLRGYKSNRFSFNVKGGRCEECQGQGSLRVALQFLPDLSVPCPLCRGKRFNQATLEVQFRGQSIADVLDMPIAQALEFFANIPAVARPLRALADVGLGYLSLGQPSSTLSGGEAQRVKLAGELARTATGRTLFLLDEPTTGLHFADVANLVNVLGRLVDAGNTMVVIEHHLDLIAAADWVIDLGPEAGEAGGFLLAAGTPAEVAACEESITGRYLRGR